MRQWLLASLLWLVSANLLAEEPPTVTLVADIWCPYNCDPESTHPGYVVELAREIYAQAGYRVVYRRQPWARALQSVSSDEMVAVIGATTDELPEAVFPFEPVGHYRGHFIVSKQSSWNYRGESSLHGVRLGVINGYDYGPFNAYVEAHRDSSDLVVLSGGDAIERGLGMLVRGRLDVFLEDPDVAMHTAQQLGLSNQLKIGASLETPIPLYLAFSSRNSKSDQLARLWSEGIQRLRETGRLQQLLASYGVEDWL